MTFKNIRRRGRAGLGSPPEGNMRNLVYVLLGAFLFSGSLWADTFSDDLLAYNQVMKSGAICCPGLGPPTGPFPYASFGLKK